MKSFKPATPFSTPLILLIPTETKSYGVTADKYPEIKNGILFFGSFKTYGGTEREVNGAYSIENTAVVETWFRPDIKGNCRVYVPEAGTTYDILGEPENIAMRNQFLKFKIIEVKGGA